METSGHYLSQPLVPDRWSWPTVSCVSFKDRSWRIKVSRPLRAVCVCVWQAGGWVWGHAGRHLTPPNQFTWVRRIWVFIKREGTSPLLSAVTCSMNKLLLQHRNSRQQNTTLLQHSVWLADITVLCGFSLKLKAELFTVLLSIIYTKIKMSSNFTHRVHLENSFFGTARVWRGDHNTLTVNINQQTFTQKRRHSLQWEKVREAETNNFFHRWFQRWHQIVSFVWSTLEKIKPPTTFHLFIITD